MKLVLIVFTMLSFSLGSTSQQNTMGCDAEKYVGSWSVALMCDGEEAPADKFKVDKTDDPSVYTYTYSNGDTGEFKLQECKLQTTLDVEGMVVEIILHEADDVLTMTQNISFEANGEQINMMCQGGLVAGK